MFVIGRGSAGGLEQHCVAKIFLFIIYACANLYFAEFEMIHDLACKVKNVRIRENGEFGQK